MPGHGRGPLILGHRHPRLVEALRALEEGIYALPDGRFYVSAVHSEEDVAETLAALERVFEGLA